jgi:hypothetical protein
VGVEGSGPHLQVIGLGDNAALGGPESLQIHDHILKGQHLFLCHVCLQLFNLIPEIPMLALPGLVCKPLWEKAV